ncbi:hypothetical protein [Dyella sp. 2RAB6]|uniref:hypothetical protein n=1 Tax=Dyella sp. 2RAB6 TaxID=3232992 RepID=UPI003F93710C
MLRTSLCLALLVSTALAAPRAYADEPGVAQWTPVSEARLDAARGGFDLGAGLIASLGLDRVVYVDGTLVTSTHLQIPDVAHLTPAQASALSSAINTAAVVQVGPGNRVDPAALGQNAATTVVQNTLDNQRIAAITTLNVSVNTLSAFRSLNLGQSLQSALANPLGR